jgi:putative DNA primase/helicase
MIPQHFDQSETLRQFADAVYRDTGATIQPIADSELHRFDDPEGRRGNLAGWYVLHLDSYPAGAYGSWRTGIQYTWRMDSDHRPDPAEQARLAAIVRTARDKRDRERTEAQAQAAIRAQALWRDAMPATVAHPYIASKRIPALGLRQAGPVLLVPLRTLGGELVNVQRIGADGSKRFLQGGRVKGCFALVGREIPQTGELYIAEGWATAATIHQSLRVPVVAALFADNLKPVALAIRNEYPRLALVVAADNDHRTEGNPGIAKGREAASAVEGALTWPTVCMAHDCCCTDFNDTAQCKRAAR